MNHPRNVYRGKRDVKEPVSKIIRGLLSPDTGKAMLNPFVEILKHLGIPIDESFNETPMHVVLSSFPTKDGAFVQGLMADAGDDEYAGFEDEMLSNPEHVEDVAGISVEEETEKENKLESMISEIRESLSEASDALHDLTDTYQHAHKK